MRILDQLAMSVASAPAWAFAAVYLALFFGAGLSLQQGGGGVHQIFLWSSAIVALQIGWLWGVYLLTRSAAAPLLLRWLFVLPLLFALFAGALITYNQAAVGLAMSVNSLGSVCFLGALWVGAGAFVERQTSVRPPPIGDRLGTAILMLYAPIGVFWIRPKISGLSS